MTAVPYMPCTPCNARIACMACATRMPRNACVTCSDRKALLPGKIASTCENRVVGSDAPHQSIEGGETVDPVYGRVDIVGQSFDHPPRCRTGSNAHSRHDHARPEGPLFTVWAVSFFENRGREQCIDPNIVLLILGAHSTTRVSSDRGSTGCIQAQILLASVPVALLPCVGPGRAFAALE